MLWHIQHLMFSCVVGLCQFENDQLQLPFMMMSLIPYTLLYSILVQDSVQTSIKLTLQKHVRLDT